MPRLGAALILVPGFASLTGCAVEPPPGTGQTVQRALLAECAAELGLPLGDAQVRVEGAVIQGTTLTLVNADGLSARDVALVNDCKNQKASRITRGQP